MKRRNHTYENRFRTKLSINNNVQGDSLQVQLERLQAGEGLDSVEDRELVYYDNETTIINPLANIRSDKMELMVDEKIGEFEFRHRIQQVKEPENKEPDGTESGEE